MSEAVLGPLARVALRAVLSRLIPADDLGPGAVQAGVDGYIVAALGGALAALAGDYRAGAAVDEESLREAGSRFADLDACRQDELLARWAQRAPDGARGGLGGFFEMVREHAIEGFLGDPRHGGNRDHAGCPHRLPAVRPARHGRAAGSDLMIDLPPCDVVVVGLGAAGGLAATLLAEAGLSVVGIEAGTGIIPTSSSPTRSATRAATSSGTPRPIMRSRPCAAGR